MVLDEKLDEIPYCIDSVGKFGKLVINKSKANPQVFCQSYMPDALVDNVVTANVEFVICESPLRLARRLRRFKKIDAVKVVFPSFEFELPAKDLRMLLLQHPIDKLCSVTFIKTFIVNFGG